VRVCPVSSDGKHYYIEKGFFAMCILCTKDITLGGITDKWVKSE
jgi:hypothetical protein